ncbi:uncharacterized protein LOC134275473 [Saccostrea cucullata]|uniref:uncharacterized protein LOC134275473 n=1 Tax=Saccostrea cuccullata TaxID=36930 RepID=UPI002ED57DCF
MAVGLGVWTLVTVILTIVFIKIRKGRKESIRLQKTTEAENAPYESSLTMTGDIYLDPDYETIEEHDEGYEYLPESKEVLTVPRCLSEINSRESYIKPINTDGSYLNAMHVNSANGHYYNNHPYLDLVGDPSSKEDKKEFFDVENPKISETQ